MTPVFRFAPSPNGELHLGHAYSALLNAQLAKAVVGRLLLRIEDIDTARCTPQNEETIYRDLTWLGVQWETPVRRQSEHFPDYAEALERLVEEELVYPSFMSRGEARAIVTEAEADGQDWPRDPDGAPLFPTLERKLSASERRQRMDAGEAYGWRIDIDAAIARVSGP
jgi:glutamyl-Q tRNA(Asp) synthetase